MVQDIAKPQRESAIPTIMWPRLLIFGIARRHALVELEYPPMRWSIHGMKNTFVCRFLRSTTPSYHEETPSPFHVSVEDRVIGISLRTTEFSEQFLSEEPLQIDVCHIPSYGDVEIDNGRLRAQFGLHVSCLPGLSSWVSTT